MVNTTQRSGGYILGFRVDPAEKLKDIFKEIDSLFQVGPAYIARHAIQNNLNPRLLSCKATCDVVWRALPATSSNAL
jgi:hypothetical protein